MSGSLFEERKNAMGQTNQNHAERPRLRERLRLLRRPRAHRRLRAAVNTTLAVVLVAGLVPFAGATADEQPLEAFSVVDDVMATDASESVAPQDEAAEAPAASEDPETATPEAGSAPEEEHPAPADQAGAAEAPEPEIDSAGKEAEAAVEAPANDALPTTDAAQSQSSSSSRQVLDNGVELLSVTREVSEVDDECDTGIHGLAETLMTRTSNVTLYNDDVIPFGDSDLILAVLVKARIVGGSQRYDKNGVLQSIKIEWQFYHKYVTRSYPNEDIPEGVYDFVNDSSLVPDSAFSASNFLVYTDDLSIDEEYKDDILDFKSWKPSSGAVSGDQYVGSLVDEYDNLNLKHGDELNLFIGGSLPGFVEKKNRPSAAAYPMDGQFAIKVTAGPSHIKYHAYASGDDAGPKGVIAESGSADWESGDYHSGQTFDVIGHPQAPEGYKYAATPFGEGGWYYVKDGQKIYASDADGNPVYWTGGDPTDPNSYVSEWNENVEGGAIAARCGENREMHFDFAPIKVIKAEKNWNPSAPAGATVKFSLEVLPNGDPDDPGNWVPADGLEGISPKGAIELDGVRDANFSTAAGGESDPWVAVWNVSDYAAAHPDAKFRVVESSGWSGYRVEGSPTDHNTTVPGSIGDPAQATIANIELTSVSGTKKWDDGENRWEIRPESVDLSLTRAVSGGLSESVKYEVSQDPNADPKNFTKPTLVWTNTDTDEWAYAFYGLDSVDADGNRYVYSVAEEGVPDGYRVSYGTADASSVGNGGVITNTLLTGSLQVSKTVESDYFPNASFTFAVTVTDEDNTPKSVDGYPYTVTDAHGTQLRTGELDANGQLTLKGGQTATIEGIPDGFRATVKEVSEVGGAGDLSDYWDTTINDAFTIEGSAQIANGETAALGFNNVRKKDGALEFKKTVEGDTTGAAFDFYVTVGGKLYSGPYTVEGDGAPQGDQTAQNGLVTGIKDGWTVKIAGLERGVAWKVEEAASADYETFAAEGALEVDQAAQTQESQSVEGEVGVADAPDAPVSQAGFLNVKKTGDLTVEKALSNAEDPEREFTFELTLKDGSWPEGGLPYVVHTKDDNGAYPTPPAGEDRTLQPNDQGRYLFTLKAGQKAEFAVETGLSYTVTEMQEDDFFKPVANGNASGNVSWGTPASVSYSNYVKVALLQLAKELDGTADDEFTYFVETSVDGGKTWDAYQGDAVIGGAERPEDEHDLNGGIPGGVSVKGELVDVSGGKVSGIKPGEMVYLPFSMEDLAQGQEELLYRVTELDSAGNPTGAGPDGFIAAPGTQTGSIDKDGVVHSAIDANASVSNIKVAAAPVQVELNAYKSYVMPDGTPMDFDAGDFKFHLTSNKPVPEDVVYSFKTKDGEEERTWSYSASGGKESLSEGEIPNGDGSTVVVGQFLDGSKHAAPVNADIDQTKAAASSADAGWVAFDPISIAMPGTYEFTITEVRDDGMPADYDQGVVTATVKVEERNGKLEVAEVTYQRDGQPESEDAPKFENVRTVGEVTVEKKVESVEDADLNKRFEFTASLVNEAGDPQSVEGVKYSVNGAAPSELTAAGKFWLAGGQTAVFKDIPTGWKLIVKETEPLDADDWTVVDSVDDATDKQAGLTASADAMASATFTNSRTPVIAKDNSKDGQLLEKGDTLVYTLTLTNPQAAPADGSRPEGMQATVHDTLPAQLEVESWSVAAGGGAPEAQNGPWNQGPEGNVVTLPWARDGVPGTVVISLNCKVTGSFDSVNAAGNVLLNQASLDYEDAGGHKGSANTDTKVNLLEPEVGYEMTKMRTTAAHSAGEEGFGFAPGTKDVAYEVTIRNTGDLSLTMDVADAFAGQAAQWFENVRVESVEGDGVQDGGQIGNDAASRKVTIASGKQAVVTFVADVRVDAPENLDSEALNKGEGVVDNNPDGGYQNVATVSDAEGSYNRPGTITVTGADGSTLFEAELGPDGSYDVVVNKTDRIEGATVGASDFQKVDRNDSTDPDTLADGSSDDRTPVKAVEASFTVSKARVSEASPKPDGSGFGFVPGSEVTYEITIENTGDLPLTMTVSDRFEGLGANCFDNLMYEGVRGAVLAADSPSLPGSDAPRIVVASGDVAVVTVTAVVAADAPEFLAPDAADNKDDDQDGYLNIAQASNVTAYDEESGITYGDGVDDGPGVVELPSDGAGDHPLADRSDTANTPVREYAVGFTMEKARLSDAEKLNGSDGVYGFVRGATVEYAVTVSNTGELPLTMLVDDKFTDGAYFKDVRFAELSMDGSTWTADAQGVVSGLGTSQVGLTLPAGKTAVLTVQATVAADAPVLSDSASNWTWTGDAADDANAQGHQNVASVTDVKAWEPKDDGSPSENEVPSDKLNDASDTARTPVIEQAYRLAIDNVKPNADRNDPDGTNEGGHVEEAGQSSPDKVDYQQGQTAVSWKPDAGNLWQHATSFTVQTFGDDDAIAADSPDARYELNIPLDASGNVVCDENGAVALTGKDAQEFKKRFPNAVLTVDPLTQRLSLDLSPDGSGMPYATRVDVSFDPSIRVENTTEDDEGGLVSVGTRPGHSVEDGRVPGQTVVSGVADPGWRVDVDNIVVKVPGTGAEHPVNPDENGRFSLVVDYPGVGEVNVTGQVEYVYDEAGNVVEATVTLDALPVSLDVGIPFKPIPRSDDPSGSNPQEPEKPQDQPRKTVATAVPRTGDPFVDLAIAGVAGMAALALAAILASRRLRRS